MVKTLTETVGFWGKSKASGGQWKPCMSSHLLKIPLESRAQQFFSVSAAGFPPLEGTHMMVC